MKRKACTWIVWRRNKCWISWVLWPYLIYWDSQKAITGEQVLHLCILNSHHTLFLTKFLPSDSKRWKDMKLLSSHYNPHQVRPLFMRVTWTNNIAQKLFSSKVMKIMEAHFKFYSISRWTICLMNYFQCFLVSKVQKTICKAPVHRTFPKWSAWLGSHLDPRPLILGMPPPKFLTLTWH